MLVNTCTVVHVVVELRVYNYKTAKNAEPISFYMFFVRYPGVKRIDQNIVFTSLYYCSVGGAIVWPTHAHT